MMHIGFLLNHYTGHQAYHVLPIAYALSGNKDVKVSIIVSSTALHKMARDLGDIWGTHHCHIIKAHVPFWVDLIDPLTRQFIFLKKKAVLDHNTALFKTLDALVVPEKTSLSLKKNKALAHLKMIRIRHGAGDRATGLDDSNKDFDLILTSGQKMQERLMSDQNIAKEKLPIIGYPKFDMTDKLPPPRPLFNNGKKTVLYNPHFRRDESSWVKMGMDVLHFFKDSNDYNLIFAPHILLYQRALRHGAKNLHAFKNCPNIHIDTGSDALIDMTYTRQADIYLGDVSSQIYEFLRQPCPCLFLNAHHIHDWQNKQTFKHWQCGDVCESIDDLEHALTQIDTWKNRYLHTQKQLLDDTFSQKGTASRNAARAIVNYLEITQG